MVLNNRQPFDRMGCQRRLPVACFDEAGTKGTTTQVPNPCCYRVPPMVCGRHGDASAHARTLGCHCSRETTTGSAACLGSCSAQPRSRSLVLQ